MLKVATPQKEAVLHPDSFTMSALFGVFVFIIGRFVCLFVCVLFLLIIALFSLLFRPDIFLYSPPLDIDQLKLILRLVGTPGAELLKKISSESVS